MENKLVRYEIRFKSKNENGVYYIKYKDKERALKAKKLLQDKFLESTWSVRKVLLNRWIKR